ncbi:hypothetical protein CcaCcLH18_14381 [Colletotrichum camelliae]|nr:hypothetical protein CcaCcLH18_14381 [Colletotrichum camelliae]
MDFPRVKHIHARLRNTATNYVQRFINRCPDLKTLSIERWTCPASKIFCLCSAAGNLTHLNVSVESGPAQDESDSDIEGDSNRDSNIGSITSLVRGIPTLQYANLMFTKNRQGQGLTSKAALTHDEVNGMPYFPRLERLEIKLADAAAIEEVGRISNLTYLHVDASCSRHAGARILSHSLRDLVHLQTLKITNSNSTAPDEEQWDTRSVMTLIQKMECLQHLQLDVGDDVLETSEGLLRRVCYGRPSLETLAMGFSACLPTKAGGPHVVLGLGRPQLRTLALGNVITGEGRIAGAEEVAFMAEGLWEIFPEMESLTVPCAGTVAVGGGSRE